MDRVRKHSSPDFLPEKVWRRFKIKKVEESAYVESFTFILVINMS